MDQPLPPVSYERGTLFFKLVEGLPLVPGERYDTHVFFSLEGQVREISLHVSDPVEIETPLGTFETIPVITQGGSPNNIMYVTTGEQPRIVRIDVLGQSMHFELVATDPPVG